MFKVVLDAFDWNRARKEDPRDPIVIGERLREAMTATKAEIGRVAESPVPLSEWLAIMEAEVDALGARWRADNAHRIVKNLSGGYESRASDGAYARRRPRLLLLNEAEQHVTVPMLAGLFPDVLKASLEAMGQAHVGAEGPPQEARRRQLEVLFARLRSQVEEYEAFCSACSELDPPIALPSLTGLSEWGFASDVDAAKRAARDAKRPAGLSAPSHAE